MRAALKAVVASAGQVHDAVCGLRGALGQQQPHSRRPALLWERVIQPPMARRPVNLPTRFKCVPSAVIVHNVWVKLGTSGRWSGAEGQKLRFVAQRIAVKTFASQLVSTGTGNGHRRSPECAFEDLVFCAMFTALALFLPVHLRFRPCISY